MTYTITSVINAPIELVQEFLTDIEHQLIWRKWATSIDPLKGDKEGISAARYTYLVDKRKTIIKEVLLINNLPTFRKVKTYAIGAYSVEEISLKKGVAGSTELVIKTDMTPERFSIKILMWLLPSLFKKQTQMLVDQLKEYAESKHQVNK
jgi:hypothetical protein